MVARFLFFIFSITIFLGIIGAIAYYLFQWKARTQIEKVKKFEDNEYKQFKKKEKEIWK